MLDLAGENRPVAIYVFNGIAEQFRILIFDVDIAVVGFSEIAFQPVRKSLRFSAQKVRVKIVRPNRATMTVTMLEVRELMRISVCHTQSCRIKPTVGTWASPGCAVMLWDLR
jgi:hypothetical protein